MPLRARKEKTEVRIFRREWREKKSENWQVQVVKGEWTSSKRWYYKKKKKVMTLRKTWRKHRDGNHLPGEVLFPRSKSMSIPPGWRGNEASSCSNICFWLCTFLPCPARALAITGWITKFFSPWHFLFSLSLTRSQYSFSAKNKSICDCASFKPSQWHVTKEVPLLQQGTAAFRSPRSIKQGRIG